MTRPRNEEATRVASGLGAAWDADGAPGTSVPKLETGILGFDKISLGGLPAGRTTLVAGAAGSGKTVFAGQFLVEGARRDQPGVFVTFEEPAEDLRRNLLSLGWPLAELEQAGAWRFVDASPVGLTHPQDYDLDVLLARIEHEIDRSAAQRVVLDSLSAVFTAGDGNATLLRQRLRQFLFRLRRLHLTVVMTVEREPESVGHGATFCFEEFLADCVVVLRNSLEEEKRRRTIEVLKIRGARHRRGEFPFTVLPGQGLVVIPLSVIELSQPSTGTRINSGNATLDEMCGGGFFRDSVVLASGATGTGKSLLVTEFLAGGTDRGERCLLFAFEESHDQFFRNAAGWGRDLARDEREGRLRVVASYPEVAALEDHLVEMTREIESFHPDRVAVDSLSALERSGTARGFREFMIVFTSYLKAGQTAALFTASAPTLLGGDSASDAHISTLTDSIILLRYAEVAGDVQRGITVLKMRGSRHDTRIRRFTISERGMEIDAPLTAVTGILSGRPLPIGIGLERLGRERDPD